MYLLEFGPICNDFSVLFFMIKWLHSYRNSSFIIDSSCLQSSKGRYHLWLKITLALQLSIFVLRWKLLHHSCLIWFYPRYFNCSFFFLSMEKWREKKKSYSTWSTNKFNSRTQCYSTYNITRSHSQCEIWNIIELKLCSRIVCLT